MTRSFDFTTAIVVTLVAFVWHRIGVGFLAPDSTLFGIVSSGPGVLNETARISFWFEIGVVWIPMIAIGGVWVYVFVREFRRQIVTGAGSAGPGRPR